MKAVCFTALLLVLVSCGGPLDILTGGGPNVAANVQAGKTNTQTIGTTTVNEQKLVRPQARSIEQSTGQTHVKAEEVRKVVVNEIPAWIIIAFAVALLMDSPLRMIDDLVKAFSRKRKGAA